MNRLCRLIPLLLLIVCCGILLVKTPRMGDIRGMDHNLTVWRQAAMHEQETDDTHVTTRTTESLLQTGNKNNGIDDEPKQWDEEAPTHILETGDRLRGDQSKGINVDYRSISTSPKPLQNITMLMKGLPDKDIKDMKTSIQDTMSSSQSQKDIRNKNIESESRKVESKTGLDDEVSIEKVGTDTDINSIILLADGNNATAKTTKLMAAINGKDGEMKWATSTWTTSIWNKTQCSSQYMTIYAFDGRRTGNLLFNFAMLMATAWQNNFTPVLYPEFVLHRTFKLNVNVVDDIRSFMNGSKPFHQMGAGVYDSKVEHLRDVGYNTSNVTLHGFFQSWKFFRCCQDRLREHLKFPPDTLKAAMEFYRTILPNATLHEGTIPKVYSPNVTLIGMHVRRDDIMSKLNFGYTFPEMSFFKNSMEYFSERFSKTYFVICSDDIEWCKKNLSDLQPNIIFSEKNAMEVDLAILTMCDHVIMSTGTFGWWAAWLANGTAIYYNNWPRPNSTLFKQIVKDDFFMPHWIPME